MRNRVLVFTAAAAFSILGLSLAYDARVEQAPFSVRSEIPHDAQIINSGVAALELRLQMIERAQESIEIEYFIYNTDVSGRLLTRALLKKKRENPEVQIRLLIDGSPTVVALDDFHAREMVRRGLEFKYYNPRPLFMLVATQYRNHRKNLIIDGKEAILGGRNIGDEYFDLSPRYNFVDRDIWVKGPIVASIRESFNHYWDHERSMKHRDPQEPRLGENPENYAQLMEQYQKREAQALEFFKERESDQAIRRDISRVAAPLLADASQKGLCVEPWFVTDKPGFVKLHNWEAENRGVAKAIGSRMGEMKEGEELFVESPYFILKDYGMSVFESLVQRGVHATLLTNSLGSTDAFYVAAIFNPRVTRYTNHENVRLFVHSGKAPVGTEFVRDEEGNEVARKAEWGLHAKTNLYGKDAFSIGTFNIDPRSANINGEETLFCERSPELAAVLKENMLKNIGEARQLAKDGSPVDGKGHLEGSGFSKVVFYLMSILPASQLDFLF